MSIYINQIIDNEGFNSESVSNFLNKIISEALVNPDSISIYESDIDEIENQFFCSPSFKTPAIRNQLLAIQKLQRCEPTDTILSFARRARQEARS